MTANTKTLERPEPGGATTEAGGPSPSSPASGAGPSRGPYGAAAQREPDSTPDRGTRRRAIPNQPADDEPLDYWEEVALSRLRLAQWALIATLIASVIIALVLG